MAKTDEAYLQVLAGCTEACSTMDLSDDGWTPPDGTYDVCLEEFVTGTKEKTGVTNVWIKPSFTIIDGEFGTKTFTDFYWIPPNSDGDSFSLKNLLRLATCMAGREVRDPVESCKILGDAVGEFLSVEVYRTTSRKTGKTYSNIRFLSRLETTEVSEEAEAETTE